MEYQEQRATYRASKKHTGKNSKEIDNPETNSRKVELDIFRVPKNGDNIE